MVIIFIIGCSAYYIAEKYTNDHHNHKHDESL